MQIEEEHVREKFIKDFGLPIVHPRSPYFEYALDTYEDYYGAKTKYNNFIEATQRYGGFKQFTQDAKKLSVHIGELMSSTPAYKRFSDPTNKLEEYDPQQIGVPYMAAVYVKERADQYMISIDMTKANFNCLRLVSKEIVLGCDTYEEMVKKCMNEDSVPFNEDLYRHLLQCKRLRQLIFGHMDTKRIAKVEVYYTQMVIKTILESGIADLKQFIAYTADEIWLTSTDIKNDMESIRKLFDEKLPTLSPILKVEGFQLKHLNAPHRTTVGFVKEYVDGRRPDFKKTYQTYFAQVFKHYFKLPVTPHDRVFIFDGFISSMDTYLY